MVACTGDSAAMWNQLRISIGTCVAVVVRVVALVMLEKEAPNKHFETEV